MLDPFRRPLACLQLAQSRKQIQHELFIVFQRAHTEHVAMPMHSGLRTTAADEVVADAVEVLAQTAA